MLPSAEVVAAPTAAAAVHHVVVARFGLTLTHTTHTTHTNVRKTVPPESSPTQSTKNATRKENNISFKSPFQVTFYISFGVCN